MLVGTCCCVKHIGRYHHHAEIPPKKNNRQAGRFFVRHPAYPEGVIGSHLGTTSAVTTGSGVPGSLLAGLLESCQILLALSR